jgi:probable DNA metabolism protein
MNKNAGNFNGILAQSGQSQSNHNNREDLSEDRIVLSDNQTAREILLTVPTPEISEIYIASFHPETNVLPLVAEHFTKRLLNQTFIIIDRKRNTCAVHVAGQDFELMVCNPETIKNICYESSYEELWQEYFKNMAIAERINKNLQRSNMPLKYRKYLIEKT